MKEKRLGKVKWGEKEPERGRCYREESEVKKGKC